MEKFKVYRIREVEKKVVARFEELALEDLDEGEVVARVAYSSVNYKDALAATGAGKIVRRFPCVGGIDLSGTVTESADPRFKRGDAIICTSYDLGVAHDGGYAEYARIPADWAVPMPKGMSLFEAMALGTAGYTAGLAVTRMEANGLQPAIGLAASMNLNTTVAPFILRGVSLLGIDSGSTPMPLRREIWGRLALDMRPEHLKDMTRTISFDELPRAFDGLLKGAAKGRIVVDLAA